LNQAKIHKAFIDRNLSSIEKYFSIPKLTQNNSSTLLNLYAFSRVQTQKKSCKQSANNQQPLHESVKTHVA
jgi:hypothetical protein